MLDITKESLSCSGLTLKLSDNETKMKNQVNDKCHQVQGLERQAAIFTSNAGAEASSKYIKMKLQNEEGTQSSSNLY